MSICTTDFVIFLILVMISILYSKYKSLYELHGSFLNQNIHDLKILRARISQLEEKFK